MNSLMDTTKQKRYLFNDIIQLVYCMVHATFMQHGKKTLVNVIPNIYFELKETLYNKLFKRDGGMKDFILHI